MNYVIGDIQGCLDGLESLLIKINFSPKKDKLWAVGDLVARGRYSLETVRFLRILGESFQSVLGNHDLHLMAYYYGCAKVKSNDLLDTLVDSADFEDTIKWMSEMPLAIRLNKHTLICHAGLYPVWSFKQAIEYSDEVTHVLRFGKAKKFFENMYGNSPSNWNSSLKGYDRLRFITNAFTRMRFLDNTQLDFKFKCHPHSSPKHLKPWFDTKNPNLKKEQKVIFGHWASLNGETNKEKFIALDTGFVWGKSMTAFCIETGKKTAVLA